MVINWLVFLDNRITSRLFQTIFFSLLHYRCKSRQVNIALTITGRGKASINLIDWHDCYSLSRSTIILPKVSIWHMYIPPFHPFHSFHSFHSFHYAIIRRYCLRLLFFITNNMQIEAIPNWRSNTINKHISI